MRGKEEKGKVCASSLENQQDFSLGYSRFVEFNPQV